MHMSEGASVTSSAEALILTAERLYAERGIANVSAREIAAAAGQRNTSAVGYHFGSMDGLINAVFDYRMARIDQQRQAMLAELDRRIARGTATDLADVVATVVEPLAASIGHSGGTSWYARFLQQAVVTAGIEVLAPARAAVTHGLRDATARLFNLLVELPEPIRAERVRRSLQMATSELAVLERTLASGTAALDRGAFVADLFDSVVGVLEAPVSPRTQRQLLRCGITTTKAQEVAV